MVTTSATINAIVDSVIADLTSFGTTTLGLGASPRVYERDEHPQAAMNRGDLPCAYVIPIMEGGDIISTDMDDLPHLHIFPITVTAYYMGNDDTSAQLGTDLRTVRNYGYNFIDIYKTKTNGGYFATGGWIKDPIKLEVGYWVSGGGKVVHFWIVKFNVTALIA